ncbi:MAG: glycosyltransferase family 2 protein [Thermoanaerobaculia bacterium]
MILFTKLAPTSTPLLNQSPPFYPAALVPAFRCEGTIGRVVSGLLRSVAVVLVVDDGSKDATAAVAEQAGARVLIRETNGGKGSALRSGLALLLKDSFTHIAFVDGDGQHAAEDLPRLLDASRQGADFVIGSRLRARGDMPGKNYWANTMGDRVLSRMTGLPVEDGQSGFRVIEANLLRSLRLEASRYSIENEILIKSCRKVTKFVTVPVQTIYGSETRHYRPFRDTWVTAWLSAHYKTTGSDES